MISLGQASSAAASVSHAYKSDASQKTLGESSAQNMADKNDRNCRGGSTGRPGLKYSMLHIMCVCGNPPLVSVGVLFICL